jgi:hypothetical protein
MTDLTKIEKPFGLLDDETQSALREYDGTIEWFNGSIWVCNGHTFFYNSSTYRAVPPKLPEWPAGLRSEWRWIAMNEDGGVCAYDERPRCRFDIWTARGQSFRVDRLIDVSFDGVPWKQAIIQRPEGV